MTTIFENDVLVSPQEYLRTEPSSFEKREYIEGVVYALTDFTIRHNIVSGNVMCELHRRLSGKIGQVFGSQTKVRLQMPNGKLRFYYPDVQIVSESNPWDDVYQDKPVLVVEVTSPSTWRADHVEKLEAYKTIPTLECYLLVETRHCEMLAYQRIADIFKPFLLTNLNDKLILNKLGLELTLAEIYAGVVFPPPSDASDADE
jgi:Uma2 family endonuclease